MEILALRVSEGPTVKFRGELLVSHEINDKNVRIGAGIHRITTRRWEIYQQQDDSWVLYFSEHRVGSPFLGKVQHFVSFLELDNALRREDEQLADLLLNTFLDTKLPQRTGGN